MCSVTAPLTATSPVTQGRTPLEAVSLGKKNPFFRGNPFCAGAPCSALILVALNSVMKGTGMNELGQIKE